MSGKLDGRSYAGTLKNFQSTHIGYRAHRAVIFAIAWHLVKEVDATTTRRTRRTRRVAIRDQFMIKKFNITKLLKCRVSYLHHNMKWKTVH